MQWQRRLKGYSSENRTLFLVTRPRRGPRSLRAFSTVDESACNPKPKSLRQAGRKPSNVGHNDLANDKAMSRQQTGYIWKVGGSWFGRWRDDVIENGRVVRKQRSVKLAAVCDRYRTKADVRPLLAEKLRPIDEGKMRPESTLPLAEFVEKHYLPFIEENFKPSTIAGYKTLWETYLAPRVGGIALRDFRTVDAKKLLADVHRARNLGRTMLKHIKSLLSGVFTYAKNLGVLDGLNPVRDAMIPHKAAAPKEAHATAPDGVLAIIGALEEAGELQASAAIALMFFAGLRPCEARGGCWEDYNGKGLLVRQSVWHTYTTSPKTEGSEKFVPIIEPLRSIMATLRKADGNPSSGPILRGPSGKPLDLHNLVNRVVIPTLKKAGLSWHGAYSMRRGVSTTVTAISKDPLAAKGLMRHSSVSTTARHYIKDVPENTLKAMKQLETLCNDCATEQGTKPAN
jgi:integrase